MTFDPKCFDLARSFLSDNPELDSEKLAPILAAHIQETIEEFIEGGQTPVTSSCGCVFCDLGLEPFEAPSGGKVHFNDHDLVGCTKAQEAA